MQDTSVSTAEKKLALEAFGIPWPVCSCCNLPKKWNSQKNRLAGGSWKLRCTGRARDSIFQWRQLRTPGTYRCERNLANIDERMQKYIPGTQENIDYMERIKERWLTKSNVQN